MHLDHERSMIGVQCQLMICRGHTRASKGYISNFFVVDGSLANGHFSSILHFDLHLSRI